MKKLIILMLTAAAIVIASVVMLFGSKTYNCEVERLGDKPHTTIGPYVYHAKVEDYGYKFKVFTDNREYDSGLLSDENFNGIPIKFSSNKISIAYAKNDKGLYQLIELYNGDNIVNLKNCTKI